MNVKTWPTLVIVLGIAAICGLAIAGQRPEVVNVPLKPTAQNAGKMAIATLVPTGPTTTQIVLFVSGLPSQTAWPAQLYSYIYPGPCGNLAARPAFDLNQRVRLGEMQPMRMWKSVPTSMSELRSGNYALVLRASPADGFFDVFCGNLGHAT